MINKIRKSLLITGFILMSSNIVLKAQQEPMYTQYMHNTMAVNPGYTGTRNAMNLLALTRHQWVGFNGAPSTQTFALHTPINNRKV